MAELRCSVENCTYNNDRCCCKGDIMDNVRAASGNRTDKIHKQEKIYCAIWIKNPAKLLQFSGVKCVVDFFVWVYNEP